MKWLYGAVVGAVLLAGLSWGAPGVTVIFRRGAAADWTAANPTLQNGEPGYETDTGLIKTGTGLAAWNALPYNSAFKGYTGHNFPTNTTGGYSGLAVNSVCAGRFCTYSTMHQACAQAGEVHVNTALDPVHSNYSSATMHACLAPIKFGSNGSLGNTTTFWGNFVITDNSQHFTGTGVISGLSEARPEWFGAFPDSTDHTSAMNTVAVQAQAGTQINFRSGVYMTGAPWNFTNPVRLIGTPGGVTGTRIELSGGSHAYVIQLDGTGAVAGYKSGSTVSDIIFDGHGFATDAIVLKGQKSCEFPNLRGTNVTGACLHLINLGAQSSWFPNFKCSTYTEPMSTVPANGVLMDGTSNLSSDNLFPNIGIEGLTGSGIKILSGINNVFINGTSEINNLAVELGETAPGGTLGMRADDNTFIGMDNEANTQTLDVVVRASAHRNDFLSLRTGGISFINSNFHHVMGGTIVNGASLDSNSSYNVLRDFDIYTTTATVTDLGGFNTIKNVSNVTDVTVVPEKDLRRKAVFTLAGGATATINAGVTSFAEVVCNGSTAIIGVPTNAADGQEMDISIFNTSGGAITITWATGAGGFKQAGWTNPASTTSRSGHFRYDGANNLWYLVAYGQTDVPN